MPDSASSNGTLRVFLSYASQDAAAARQIAEALTAAGIEAWFDQSELRGGDAWDQKIRLKIRECQLFVPVISGNTQARAEGYFRLEWHLAEQRSFLMANDQPFIVPVVIDGTDEALARVPDRFRERQWTRLPGGVGAAEFAVRLLGLAGTPARKAAARPSLDAAIPAARSDRSVAVLAFANLSADRDNEYFSDGISDELLTLLQGIPGLRVAARTSAFSFKGKSATAEEIGGRLGVSNLVEGSVQKAGSKVKISARLSSTSGEVRWSKSFTRELNDVFALQEEIAGAIVGELKGQLSGAGTEVAAQVAHAVRGGTRNAVAYEHYLLGRHYYSQTQEETMKQAIEQLDAAIAADPRYAMAWVCRARALTWQCGYQTISQPEFSRLLAEAKRSAERALEVEPGLAEAEVLMAWIEFAFEFRMADALRRIKPFLEGAPCDPDFLETALTISSAGGRPEDQAVRLRQLVSLDPVNVRLRTQLCLALIWVNLPQEARAEARRVRELGPKSVFGQTLMGFIEVYEGNLEAADRELAAAPSHWSSEWLRALVLALKGRREECRRAADRFTEVYGDSAAIQAASIYASNHDADRAMDLVERARRQRDPGLLTLRGTPFFDPIRENPRWNALWADLGLQDR